ncbi:hypothetical protein GQX73_g6032 [Xylaria multiplex]|uniref:EKC/KEOPS complex subunit BUD32 n=1 Tax=Xylaria multiplex TaxID=323545 RepID=A0A7C8MR98_9PEZI|nr:hypothetical protein GQX73_g6032 [Xylaria multiplex]
MSRLFYDKDIGAEQLEAHHIVMAEEAATFWIEGPNGKHLCSILPVLGPSLSEWRDLAVGFDAVRAKKVCYEITEGIHFLHEHGICHGDLRPQNILMRLANGGLDHMDPDDLFQVISLHNRHEVRTIDGSKSLNAPKWVIEPLNWFQLKDLILDDVAIVDFGEAFEAISPPSALGIPRPYASPEVTYGGASLGKESDMWSLAITLLEVRTGEHLDGFLTPLSRMESIAGPIPPPYRSIAAEELYQEKLENFQICPLEDEAEPRPPSEKLLESTRSLSELFWMESQADREVDYSAPESVTKIEDYLAEELWERVLVPKEDNLEEGPSTATLEPYQIPESEITMLGDLLRGMLKYAPHDRTNISSALEHPWFKIESEESEDKKIEIEQPEEQLLSSESKRADTPRETHGEPERPEGQSRIKISRGQILSWSYICLPILLSLIVLWKSGWRTEGLTIKRLEVVNIVVAPTHPWTDTN